MEHPSPDAVQDRIYNCTSAKELIADGTSDRPELRIFETGWTGGNATHFVTEPLFLLDHPGELTRFWASIPLQP